MTILSMLFIKLFPILFIAVFAAAAGFSLWTFIRRKNGGERSVSARAVLKLCTVRGGETPDMIYSVDFVTEKDEKLTLTVPEKIFEDFSCGDSGRLTFRNSEIISFERE